MTDRNQIDEKAKAFFDDLWKKGDPWDLETSEFERKKYSHQVAMLNSCRISRALEIGCGAGSFTRLLARISDEVVGVDISPIAIERARTKEAGPGKVQYCAANIMDWDLGANDSWDLIVMNETIYYLGWLYSFFDVAWLASKLFNATKKGGYLLMANTCGGVEDYLLRPWIIRTYRDLFLNVGFRLNSEEIFTGVKNGVRLEVPISLFNKNPEKTDDVS